MELNLAPVLSPRFAFAAVTPTYQLTFSSTQQQSLARDFVAQRSRCPRTRFNIAFGGWSVSQGSSIFPEIAASAQSRRIFIDSVLSFLVSNGFNGLDIDWEVRDLV
jgi:chitinase